MIKLIVGDYKLKPEDLVVIQVSEDCLRKNFFTKDRNLVAYSDDLHLSKKDLDELIEIGYDLTLVIHDRKLVKGKRKETKKYTLTYLEEQSTNEVNPFELVKLIFSCKDRDLLFNFLKDSKNSLYVCMMTMSCNAHKLTENNRKVVEWLCKNYFRVKYEIVCAKIAYTIKVQQVPYFDWLYPKKKKEDEDA